MLFRIVPPPEHTTVPMISGSFKKLFVDRFLATGLSVQDALIEVTPPVRRGRPKKKIQSTLPNPIPPQIKEQHEEGLEGPQRPS
jgi:hypothetical protein